MTQKKFELKDELTKELATKTEVVRLEGVMRTEVARLEGLISLEIKRLEGLISSEVKRLEGVINSEVARLEGVINAHVERLRGETKVHVERLEGQINTLRQEIKTALVKLDHKFTIMFLILLFTIIFVNQNALKFIAKLLGLIKP